MTINNHDFFPLVLNCSSLQRIYTRFTNASFFRSLNITEKMAVRKKIQILMIQNSGNYCSLKYIHVSKSSATVQYMMDNNKFLIL